MQRDAGGTGRSGATRRPSRAWSACRPTACSPSRFRILRDHHLAEDAVQQTLVTIWDELPRLRDPERFDAWSYRLIARASIAAAKRERRGPGGGALVRLLPDDADASRAPDDIGSVADRDQVERGVPPAQAGAARDPDPASLRRPVVRRRSPTSSASRSARPAPACTTRASAMRAALEADSRTDGPGRSARHDHDQRHRPADRGLVRGWPGPGVRVDHRARPSPTPGPTRAGAIRSRRSAATRWGAVAASACCSSPCRCSRPCVLLRGGGRGRRRGRWLARSRPGGRAAGREPVAGARQPRRSHGRREPDDDPGRPDRAPRRRRLHRRHR